MTPAPLPWGRAGPGWARTELEQPRGPPCPGGPLGSPVPDAPPCWAPSWAPRRSSVPGGMHRESGPLRAQGGGWRSGGQVSGSRPSCRVPRPGQQLPVARRKSLPMPHHPCPCQPRAHRAAGSLELPPCCPSGIPRGPWSSLTPHPRATVPALRPSLGCWHSERQIKGLHSTRPGELRLCASRGGCPKPVSSLGLIPVHGTRGWACPRSPGWPILNPALQPGALPTDVPPRPRTPSSAQVSGSFHGVPGTAHPILGVNPQAPAAAGWGVAQRSEVSVSGRWW